MRDGEAKKWSRGTEKREANWETERRRDWQRLRLAFILWHLRKARASEEAICAPPPLLLCVTSRRDLMKRRFCSQNSAVLYAYSATDGHSSCERRRRAIYCFHHPRSHSKLLQLGALPVRLATASASASSLVHNLRRTSLIASARNGI